MAISAHAHRCPFWLIWFKIEGDSWFTWWFNQLPGPSMFNQKGHLCSRVQDALRAKGKPRHQALRSWKVGRAPETVAKLDARRWRLEGPLSDRGKIRGTSTALFPFLSLHLLFITTGKYCFFFFFPGALAKWKLGLSFNTGLWAEIP